MSLHLNPYTFLQDHNRQLVYISALSQSNLTSTVQILNFMGRTSPKFKQKFNRPGENVPVWRNQFLPTMQSNR